MENQTQQGSTVSPTENNQLSSAVFGTSAPATGSASAPPAIPSAPGTPSNLSGPKSKSRNLAGLLSLIFGLSSLGTFLLLIFKTNLVGSLTVAYVWFGVITAISLLGVVLGLLSQRGRTQVNKLGLLGLIIATVMSIGCITIGSYYIKFLTVMNNFSETFDSSDFNTEDSLNDLETDIEKSPSDTFTQ